MKFPINHNCFSRSENVGYLIKRWRSQHHKINSHIFYKKRERHAIVLLFAGFFKSHKLIHLHWGKKIKSQLESFVIQQWLSNATVIEKWEQMYHFKNWKMIKFIIPTMIIVYLKKKLPIISKLHRDITYW